MFNIILTGTDGSVLIADSARIALWPTATDTAKVTTQNGITYVVDGSTVIWDSKDGLLNSGTQITVTSQPLTFGAPDGSKLVFGDDLIIYEASGAIYWQAGITGAKAYIWNNDGSFVAIDENGNTIYPNGAAVGLVPSGGQTVLAEGRRFFGVNRLDFHHLLHNS